MQVLIGLICLACVSVVASACGADEPAKPLNGVKIGKFLSEDASSKMDAQLTVKCPRRITPGKGKQFTCAARTGDGDEIPLTATQQDAQGNVTWHMDARSTAPIEQEIERGVLKQKQLKVEVDCPEVIAFDEGASFICLAKRATGQRTHVVVTQVDDKGGITWSA